MKLVSYHVKSGDARLGVLVENSIVDLHDVSDGELPDNMLEFLNVGDKAFDLAREIVRQIASEAIGETSARIPVDSVKLCAPISNPSKVVAIGLNYLDHVRECDLQMPELPTMFCKYPSSIIGCGDDIRWSRSLTENVDYEAELAVVIGKTARDVLEENAYDHIAGYMNCNDVSARDLQLRKGDQWLRGKCLDTFCPIGPYLVTKDEIPDPHSLSIQCLVNGEALQHSSTSHMIYKIPFLIKYLSEAFTLLPGDVIITGTPNGVGAFRSPPIWLRHGDEVTVEVQGLGRLTNRCVEESKA